MKDNRFDDIVRSKLSDLKSDSKPKWNQFLEKKKAADQVENNLYFDKNIRNAISKHRVDYNADHWTLLKARINHLTAMKQKIKGLKSLELIAFVLLLFIAHSKFNHNPISFGEPMAEMANDLDNNNLNTSESTQNNSKHIINTVASNEHISQFGNDKRISSLGSEKENSNLVKKSMFADNAAEQDGRKVIKNTEGTNGILNGNETNKNSSQVFLPIINENNTNSKTNFSDNNVLNALADIQTIERDKLILERNVPALYHDFGIKNSFGITPLQVSSSWLHVIASFDNNLIFTPDDLAYNTTARKTEMFGYTFGILYSRLIGKWELETGLTTSTYSKPWDFTQRYGNFSGWFEYRLTNIESNFVGVPLQAKYHFVQNQDWSIFGKTGLTGEFIVNSEYTSENNYLGGGPITQGSEPEIENVVSPFEEDHNFSKGIFQGGNVKDNLFIRAQIGLGIERNISENLSVYFSGEYHMSLINKKLGPNNDKINKFGFNVGVKMRIK